MEEHENCNALTILKTGELNGNHKRKTFYYHNGINPSSSPFLPFAFGGNWDIWSQRIRLQFRATSKKSLQTEANWPQQFERR